MFDPHAIKIHVDGSCTDNPGGKGGYAVRVDWGCDIDRETEVADSGGYFETSIGRMELEGCIRAHEWALANLDDLRGRRVLVLTDSSYVYGSYSWAIGWAQNDYCSSDGRPIKNEDMVRELMTLRRKLCRALRVEMKLIPRRSDEGAKEVDRTAKAAREMPSLVDRGFPKGKIGRPKNDVKKAARLYPAAGQVTIFRPYNSLTVRRGLELFKVQEFDEARKDFFEKFEVYVDSALGNELHRQRAFRVRLNDLPRFPQIVEVLEELKESDIVVPDGTMP